MIYRFFWILTKGAVRGWYKRIFYTGRENLPKAGPVIIASNHPNAFMEPVVMAVVQNRPIHFLTRGDIFEKPLNRWLLEKLKMIPIYRRIDAKNNFEKNAKTFDRSKKVLKKGGCILIFSEGICVMEKRLRPLKKGTAKLAFESMELDDWKMDLKIIPTGVNYTYPSQPRTEVMLHHGPAIAMKNYKALYEENPARAINQLTEDIAIAIEKELVVLKDKATEKAGERALQLTRNQFPQTNKFKSSDEKRLRLEQKAANAFNVLDTEQQLNFGQEAENYFQKLNKQGVKDRHLVAQKKDQPLRLFAFLIGLPLFILGYLLNILQVKFGLGIGKNKIRLQHFKACISMAATEFLNLILYVLLIGIGAFFCGFWVLTILIVPFLGYFALLYAEAWLKFRGLRKANNLGSKKTELLLQRQNLLQQIGLN